MVDNKTIDADSAKGTTAVIRDVVSSIDRNKKIKAPSKQTKIIYKLLNEQHKEDIVESALLKYYRSEELKPYQAELIKMQKHLESTGKKMIITSASSSLSLATISTLESAVSCDNRKLRSAGFCSMCHETPSRSGPR